MKKLIILLLVFNQAVAQVENGAGGWTTWVIASGKEFRLSPPPDKKATEAEVKKVQALQANLDEKAISQIMFWNAGAPGYRWEQLVKNLSGTMPMFRVKALLHVAIYDATIAAWHTKYAFRRRRPSGSSTSVKNVIAVPNTPSYPCEYSVAAGAAAAVLCNLFPEKADSIQKLAFEASHSRILAGTAYPSDAEAGMDLGRKVAEKVVERARKDGSDAVWKGKVPNKPGLWSGTNPFGATVGTWKTWVLDSSNQFRPAPPPDFAKDMDELRNATISAPAKARAFYHAFNDFWSEITDRKIFEYNLQADPPRAARVYALKSIAAYDAFVACWDAKFTYWGIRPYQYDTTFKHVLGMPPFPGYPSGHAVTSSASATVLSYLFPADEQFFKQKARECAESRFEGGIHFRTDNEIGLDMGHKIGEYIVKRARADGADVHPRLVKNR